MSFEAKLFAILLITGETKIGQRLTGISQVITVEFAEAVWIRGHSSLQTVVYVSRYKDLCHSFGRLLTSVNRVLPMFAITVKGNYVIVT